MIKCEMCKGEGTVEVSYPANNDGGVIHDEESEVKTCPECLGEGEVRTEKTCPDCGGELEEGATKCYRYPCYLPA